MNRHDVLYGNENGKKLAQSRDGGSLNSIEEIDKITGFWYDTKSAGSFSEAEKSETQDSSRSRAAVESGMQYLIKQYPRSRKHKNS